VDNARAEAERLLAEARAAGTETARRRHAALLADAETEAEAIRVAGEAEAQALLERVSSERDELIADLTTLLLPLEG
jgi:vacuolar-type H+-ATPase subunit H